MPFLPPNQQRQSTEGTRLFTVTSREKLQLLNCGNIKSKKHSYMPHMVSWWKQLRTCTHIPVYRPLFHDNLDKPVRERWIKQEMTGVLGYSGISWTICKQSASHSRQITTPTPHYSIFTGWILFQTHLPEALPTVLKHWRQIHTSNEAQTWRNQDNKDQQIIMKLMCQLVTELFRTN